MPIATTNSISYIIGIDNQATLNELHALNKTLFPVQYRDEFYQSLMRPEVFVILAMENSMVGKKKIVGKAASPRFVTNCCAHRPPHIRLAFPLSHLLCAADVS